MRPVMLRQMGEEDIVQSMRTLKINGKRPQEQQSQDRKSKRKFELIPSLDRQTLPQPSNSIKLISWSQTSEVLELLVNIPRPPTSSCFVSCESNRVVLRTPEGGRWSCPLHDEVEEQKVRVVPRGRTLGIRMEKQKKYDWPFCRLLGEQNQTPHRPGMTDANSESREHASSQVPASMDDDVADIVEVTRVERQIEKKEDFNEKPTLSVLECPSTLETVTERSAAKVYVWLPGVIGESLKVEVGPRRTTVAYDRSNRKTSEDSVDEEEKDARTLTVVFNLEILPHECCWSLLSEPNDVLELVVVKSNEGGGGGGGNTWDENSVRLEEADGESDFPKQHPVPMETMSPEMSTFDSWMTPSGRDVSTQTVVDSPTRNDALVEPVLPCVAVSAPQVQVSPDLLGADGSPSMISDDRDVLSTGGTGGGRRDIQKPTCMVSPLSSPRPVKDSHILTEVPRPTAGLRLALGRPGYVGLENLGNTCFINCVLQVLANISELKEYFLGKRYIDDINAKNPLGMGGRLASSFAQVIEALWRGEEPSFSPTLLKNLIGQKQNRFLGYLQHDAEELMELLLDGLHEDLNRVKDKLYTAHPEDQPNLDPEVAASNAWSRHKSRNDSFIVDLFQGQYHSKLACPKCGKVSITFDPFSVVQVPIPKRKVNVEVMVIGQRRRMRKAQSISRHVLLVADESNVEQVLVELGRAEVNKDMRMSNIRALEVVGSRIKKVLYGTSKIGNCGKLLLCEVDDVEDTGEPMTDVTVQQRTVLPLGSSTSSRCDACRREDVKLRRCTRCFRVSYCNQKCQREDWSRHRSECKMEGDDVGCPFVVSLPARKTTYRILVDTLEAMASLSVQVIRPGQQTPVPPPSSLSSSNGAGDGPTVKASLSDANRADHNYATFNGDRGTDVTEQKQSQPITRHDSSACQTPPFSIIPCSPPPLYGHDLKSSRGLQQPIADQGDQPLDMTSLKYVMLLWKNNYDSKLENQLIISNKELECDYHPQSAESRNVTQLQDCFKLFTEPEVLGREQSWRCSQCKSECQATKELSLWRLPTCLIIHLKRFGFSEQFFFREKIEDLIRFPTRGLDVSSYMKSKESSSASVEDQSTALPSICQNPRNAWQQGHHAGQVPSSSQSSSSLPPSSSSSSSTTYDLFGVINHHGGMLGGHYTSYARCYGDERSEPIGWRLFDDNHVTPCQESDVVTSSAYVLFYKQRQTPNITSPGPSGFPEGTQQTLPRRHASQRVDSSALSTGQSSCATHQATPISISMSDPVNVISARSVHDSGSFDGSPLPRSSSHLGRPLPIESLRDRSPETEGRRVATRGFDAARVSSSPTIDRSKPHFGRSASGRTTSAGCSPPPRKPVVVTPCGSTGMESVQSSNRGSRDRGDSAEENEDVGKPVEDVV